MNQHLTLAYSPCPNDTYIFAAWTNGLLPDAPLVEVVLGDVEELNVAARKGRYALTKVSYGAIPYLLDRYRILRAGGALGRGCGPLLVAKPGPDGTAPTLASFIPHARIAIPGKLTTAYLLLRLAHQRPIDAVPMPFDQIVAAVVAGEVEAGLIIHESRFTYQASGLTKVIDLGEWWERQTGYPIPLGAILAHRDLEPAVVGGLNETIRASLAYAQANESAVMPYVRGHAFEMDPAVMLAHVALYVNNYTRDVGQDGILAVDELFTLAGTAGLLPLGIGPDFA